MEFVAKLPKPAVTPFLRPLVKANNSTKMVMPQNTPNAVSKVLNLFAFKASNISSHRSLLNILFFSYFYYRFKYGGPTSSTKSLYSTCLLQHTYSYQSTLS